MRKLSYSLLSAVIANCMNNIFSKIKFVLKIISLPLTLLAIYLSFQLLWQVLDFPSQDALLIQIKYLFAEYGLPFLFISALIEGFFLFGSYFPGGVVIFLAVILAGGDVHRIAQIIIVVGVALTIAYSADYYLGKYGWYRLLAKFGMQEAIEQTKIRLTRHIGKGIFYGYWDTSLASITATTAGILGIPYKKFLSYSISSIFFWNTFWSTILYFTGDMLLNLSTGYVILVVVIWASTLLVHYFVTKEDSPL